MVSTSSFSKSIDVWNIGQIDLVHCRNPTHWRCPKNWQTYAVCNGLKCTFKQMQLLEEYLVSYTPNSTTLALTCCEPCKPIPNRCTRPNTYQRSLACGMCPFNVMTLMSNHLTPFHRDNGATSPWYDILVPLGHYSNGRIEIPGPGYRFRYDPGTVVGISGRIVRHGAVCLGDRVCLAYHNKTTVMDHLGMAKATWMNKSRYIG